MHKVFLNGSGKQKVIGEFVCDEISQQNTKFGVYLINYQTTSGLTAQEVCEYGNGKQVYFWKISDLVIYEQPKELSEFHKVGYTETKESVSWLTREEENSWQIKRPPQSWCYVDHPTEKGGLQE